MSNSADLDELFFEKTDNDIAPGIETAAKVILNSTEDNNPFTQNEAIFDSSAYWQAIHKSYDRSRNWLAGNIDKISEHLYRNYGVKKIWLDAHIFEIPSDDNGFNVSSPYESASIMQHFQGYDELVLYNVSSLKRPISALMGNEDDIVKRYFREFKNSLSDRQIKAANYIIPQSFSDYGLDADPIIVSEIGLDSKNLGTGYGHYVEMCLKPNTSQLLPIFHGKGKETYLVIAPREKLIDSNLIKKNICKKTGASENKITAKKIKLDFDIHDSRFSTAMHPAYFLSNQPLTNENINNVAYAFLRASQRDIAMALSAGASCESKNKTAYETDIGKRIFYLFGGGPSISILGNLENYHPINGTLAHNLATDFVQHKKSKNL